MNKEISITLEDAEYIRDSLADLLCWWDGYKTGRKESGQAELLVADFGIIAAQRLQDKIRDALNNQLHETHP